MEMLQLLEYLDSLNLETPISTQDKLSITDWIIVRHLEEVSLKKPTSITEQEYETLSNARDVWRASLNNTLLDDLNVLGESKTEKIKNSLKSSDDKIYAKLTTK